MTKEREQFLAEKYGRDLVTRQRALELAVSHYGTKDETVVVAKAETFRKFLTGETSR